jgi:hypothetical protein
LLRGVSQQYLKNLRPNALPLHDRRHVERAKIYGCIFNLFLNPANIFAIRGDNPDFVKLELHRLFCFLTRNSISLIVGATELVGYSCVRVHHLP